MQRLLPDQTSDGDGDGDGDGDPFGILQPTTQILQKWVGFLATLVALHVTPVSKSLSKSLSGQSFKLA